MTDTRLVCLPCTKTTGKIVRYICKENGYVIPYTKTNTQSSDMWECPLCLHQVLDGFGKPDYGAINPRDYLHPDMKEIEP